MGIGAPLVMGINATNGAKVMLGGFGIKFIAFQYIITLEDLNPRQRNRADNRALTAADRTIAAARIFDAIGQR